MQIPSGTQDGDKLTIKRKGISRIVDIGNHVVTVRIQVPTNLS